MLNTPNMLSVIRLCLVPVFVIVYFSNGAHAGAWAVGVYILATFTDYLDGHLARKYNLITNLGKVLDPLGDKMLTFAVLACITIDGLIPGWVVAVFVIKELLMGLGGLLIHRRAKVEIPPSNYIGKTATVMFFVICAVLILFDGIPHTAAVIMISAALAVSMAAFVSYLCKFREIMAEKKQNG